MNPYNANRWADSPQMAREEVSRIIVSMVRADYENNVDHGQTYDLYMNYRHYGLSLTDHQNKRKKYIFKFDP